MTQQMRCDGERITWSFLSNWKSPKAAPQNKYKIKFTFSLAVFLAVQVGNNERWDPRTERLGSQVSCVSRCMVRFVLFNRLSSPCRSRPPDMDTGKPIFISITLRSVFLEPHGVVPRLPGVVLSPVAWDAPFWGNANGVLGILGNAGVSRLRSYARTHLKKSLSHTCALGEALDKYQHDARVS